MKINGKKIADKILISLKKRVGELSKKNITPSVAIILVGNDPASKLYVRQKELKAENVGIATSVYQFPKSVSTQTLLNQINTLNNLDTVHGIIVQQPLPPQINLAEITQSIDPKKDVDGFHEKSKFQPPVAEAILEILKPYSLKLKKIIVIGKGETGGKPVIHALRKIGVDPIVVDSKTVNPKALTKKADIIISAVGKPQVIKPEMLKRGVILISIGLHKGSDGKLHGDYEEDQIKNIVSSYTPSPGGVGPVNVAMLLKNVIKAAENF